MNIKYLLQKEKQAIDAYKSRLVNSGEENYLDADDEELRDLRREVDIIKELIDIYSNKKSTNNDYLVVQLENLYIRAMSNLQKEEYDSLSDDEIVKISTSLFPVNWFDKGTYPKDKKINCLEAAIIYDMKLTSLEGIEILYGKGFKNR